MICWVSSSWLISVPFRIRDGIEQQLGAHTALGILAGVDLELLAGRALRLEQPLEHLVVADAVRSPRADPAPHPRRSSRQRELDLLQQFVEGPCRGSRWPARSWTARHGCARRRAAHRWCVELAGQLGELIVELGQLALLHRHPPWTVTSASNRRTRRRRAIGGELGFLAGLEADQRPRRGRR